MFEAARFVPIGNTPVMLEQVISLIVDGALTLWRAPAPRHHRPERHSRTDLSAIGASALSHHLLSRRFRRSHQNACMTSYQGLVDGLETWLRLKNGKTFATPVD
jgi:hypothetical protein